MYRYCIYGHCYSLCKQIKLKILSIIGKKKRIAGKKNGKKKKQNRLVPTCHTVITAAELLLHNYEV